MEEFSLLIFFPPFPIRRFSKKAIKKLKQARKREKGVIKHIQGEDMKKIIMFFFEIYFFNLASFV